MKKSISILGSTGSIGTTVFKIIDKKKNNFKIDILSANKIIKIILKQIKKYKPKYFIINNRTVFENVAFALRILNFSRHEIQVRVRQVLELVGLEHKSHCRSSELSGGEQQRICIARAIVNNPPI